MSIISRTSHFSEQNTTKTLKNEKFKNVLPGVWYTNSKMCNFCPAFGSCFHCYFVCPGFGRKVTGAHLYPPAQGSCPPSVSDRIASCVSYNKELNLSTILRAYLYGVSRPIPRASPPYWNRKKVFICTRIARPQAQLTRTGLEPS